MNNASELDIITSSQNARACKGIYVIGSLNNHENVEMSLSVSPSNNQDSTPNITYILQDVTFKESFYVTDQETTINSVHISFSQPVSGEIYTLLF